MVRSQGRYFSESEIKRILMLLRDSEMTLREIADRMRCSRNAVASINRKFQIRLYEGRRSQWSMNVLNAVTEDVHETTTSVTEDVHETTTDQDSTVTVVETR